MSDLISRKVLDLWNKYKPTIAVDAIEYDRELRQLLGTNLAEVSTDCISRHGTSAWLENMGHPNLAKMIMDEKRFPSTQPEPKRGKWLPDNNNYIYEQYVCSECKNSFKVDTCMGKPMWNFCPYCGAKMERRTDE